MKKKAFYVFLALFIFLFGCYQRPGVIIKDIVIGGLENDKHATSFFIINNDRVVQDCQVKIMLNNDLYRAYDLGVIKPKEEKFLETLVEYTEGETQTKVFAECKEPVQEEISSCGEKGSIERKLCVLKHNNPRLEQCLESNITDYELFCAALISKDTEICAYIESNTKKVWCQAYVTGETSLCGKIQDKKGKDWCYMDIGMNFKDPTLCGKIEDKGLKTSCNAVTTRNPQLCLEGAKEYQTTCILNLIESTSDKEGLCNLLGEQKNECLEQIK
jgi:hypothetical protein